MTPSLIVTRPKAQGQAFVEAVSSEWIAPVPTILSPLIAIKAKPVAVDLQAVTNVIFTSTNGVAAARDLGFASGTTAWCVGAKTAGRAKDAGFNSVVGPGDADGLLGLIKDAGPSGLFAHIRGTHSRGEIAARLTEAGIPCLDVVAYDQVAHALSKDAQDRLALPNPVVLPLFSPRTAAIFADHAPFYAPLHVIAISQSVAAAVKDVTPQPVAVAAVPDEGAMVHLTCATLNRLTQGENPTHVPKT